MGKTYQKILSPCSTFCFVLWWRNDEEILLLSKNAAKYKLNQSNNILKLFNACFIKICIWETLIY
jgi:hypothetical protein